MLTQTNSSISLSISPVSPESDIAKAFQLWSEGIENILAAGRLFQEVKAITKRKFTNLLSTVGLEKTQVNKLIKAASVADEIPTVVAQQLALHQILQLGQPKNRDALEAIQNDDTQITVAQKIKEHRNLQQQHKQPTKAYTRLSEKEEAIPFCLLEGYDFEFHQQPNIQQQLPQSVKQTTLTGRIEEMEAGTGSSSDDKPGQQLDNTCKANEMNQHRQGSDIYEETAHTGSNLASAQTSGVSSRREFSGQPYQESMHSKSRSNCQTIAEELVANLQSHSEFNMAATQAEDLHTEVNNNILDSILTYTPGISTDRYKQGWKVGDIAIANTVSMDFCNKCSGKPVRIDSVKGDVGTIQFLVVTRCDGKSGMSFGNWLEEIPTFRDET
ncbi:hypothetical protein ACE1AT_21725 [Pelatocladus sp. BLCC-F211]|uniref:hypothetical protein n=1 Tax=Pelatocladus sp. BLCC-F211 TaxID=3342752 RepID=UPI0035BA2A4B